MLLSTLAAHDLGYIGLGSLARRLEKTFDSLSRLEKQWGHFFNWYDTRTLKPLPPAYLSTVDSGNFLGCLVALKQGLKEKTSEPVLGPRAVAGLADTFDLIAEPWRRGSPGIERLLQNPPNAFAGWTRWLEELEHEAELRLLKSVLARGSDA